MAQDGIQKRPPPREEPTSHDEPEKVILVPKIPTPWEFCYSCIQEGRKILFFLACAFLAIAFLSMVAGMILR